MMTRKIYLFIPCLVEQIYPQTATATIEILQYLGYEIIIPPKQTCCGQPAYNSGYTKESVRMAEAWLQRFADAEYIVAPSGSCISIITESCPLVLIIKKFLKKSVTIRTSSRNLYGNIIRTAIFPAYSMPRSHIMLAVTSIGKLAWEIYLLSF